MIDIKALPLLQLFMCCIFKIIIVWDIEVAGLVHQNYRILVWFTNVIIIYLSHQSFMFLELLRHNFVRDM